MTGRNEWAQRLQWRPGGNRTATRGWANRRGLRLLAAPVALAVLLPTTGDQGALAQPPSSTCTGVRVTGWRQDTAVTREFARYGNDNRRTDDWTGGDGTRSVRLPDGRTLWLSGDTFLDRVHHGHSRTAHPRWVRNAGLVMSPQGRLQRTLHGAAHGRPGALFPGGSTAGGHEVWHWPAQATVEPRRPGSREQVVRVLLWQRETGRGAWKFGMPRATRVATLSLPDLRLENIRTVHPVRGQHPVERRVLYGTSAVTEGRWTYVYGADEGTAKGTASRAHLARVPRGRLADPAAWRYWGGEQHGWQRTPSRSAPMRVGTQAHRGATNTYSVVRDPATRSWLLLTMDAGGPHGQVMSDITAYRSCSPAGPWRGPHRVAKPPLPKGGRTAGAVPYNPQAHGEFTSPPAGTTGTVGSAGSGNGRALLLSYDVNVLDSTAAVQRNVDLYRPRFLRVQLGPARR